MSGTFIQNLLQAFALALPNTLIVTVVPMLVGAVFGILLAICRIYKLPVLGRLADIYVAIVRGIPLYVLIFITYYGIPKIVNSLVYHGETVYTVYSVSGMAVALITYISYATAYLSEIFRGAILAVDKGQWEAGTAFGMSHIQTFFRIIFPQAAVTALPNYSNFFVGMLKQSALVFCIAIKDLMGAAKVYAETTYKFIGTYLILALVYIVLGYLFIYLFRGIENKVRIKET